MRKLFVLAFAVLVTGGLLAPPAHADFHNLCGPPTAYANIYLEANYNPGQDRFGMDIACFGQSVQILNVTIKGTIFGKAYQAPAVSGTNTLSTYALFAPDLVDLYTVTATAKVGLNVITRELPSTSQSAMHSCTR